MSEMAPETTLPSLSSARGLSPMNLYPQGTPAAQRLNVNAPIVGPATGNQRLVYMGQVEVERWPGFPYKTNVKKPTKVDQLVPIQDARYMLETLSPAAKEQLRATADRYWGGSDWDPSWLDGIWERAINISANAKAYANKNITPVDAFNMVVEDLEKSGAGGGRAGGGGGGAAVYRGPVTTTQVTESVNLSDPGTARGLLKNALSDYLGRDATDFEQENFLKALNAAERRSPTKTEATTTTTPRGVARSEVETETMTTGGFNPSTFAEEYAQGMEGAAEFQAATTLLDTFINSLQARV